LTDEQLQIQLQISLLEELSAEANRETERLERYIDRLLAKSASVITLSGILTFVSLAFVNSSSSGRLIKYYLAWVFPFLFAAIISWILVLVRSKAITVDRVDVIKSNDSAVIIQYLEARLGMANSILHRTHATYFQTRFMFLISLALISVYMLLYTVSFYIFVFATLPNTPRAMFIELLAVGALILLYLLISKKKNHSHTETIQLNKKQ
jgi:predicted transglutaminase-like protease